MSPDMATHSTANPDAAAQRSAYLSMSPGDLAVAIARRRWELGSDLLILAHHYQRDEIVQHADFVGDSLRLSMHAAATARERKVRWIVFCGVRFMAETADILTDSSVAVILPNHAARCPMAAMADEQDVRDALDLLGQDRTVVPIVYVNSTAAVKALVGEYGGACCTSANAQHIMQWALDGGLRRKSRAARRPVVLFLPDEHLGRNVCVELGVPESAQALWDPAQVNGGVPEECMRAARVVVWKGHCYVHTRFKARDIASVRATTPGAGDSPRILVHPECTRDVVAGADAAGSTERLVRLIQDAPPGSRWVIGTEAHLVRRLARQASRRAVDVRILGRGAPMCGAMLQIAPPDLLWVLDNLAQGRIVNQITVPQNLREPAKDALERMLNMNN